MLTTNGKPLSGEITSAAKGDKLSGEIFLSSGTTSIVGLKDGRLMAFAGNRACFSDDGGASWSKEQVLLDTDGRPLQAAGHSGCIRLKSGRLAIIYSRHRGPDFLNPASKGRDSFLLFSVSSDEGATWTPERVIVRGPFIPMPYSHGALIQMSTGRLVLPARFCMAQSPAGWGGYEKISVYAHARGRKIQMEGHAHAPELDIGKVFYSDDEGETWQTSEGEIIPWLEYGYGNIVPFDEPTVAELKDGRLLMFGRSVVGRILKTYSEDGGNTWSYVEVTRLASSYSPAMLRRIPTTGDLLCIWNNVSADEIRNGFRRGRLSCAISKDDGRSWEHFRTLECSPALPRAWYVEPDPEIRLVRARKELGELPNDEDWVFDYPDVSFVGDRAFLTYFVMRKFPKDPGPNPNLSDPFRRACAETGVESNLKIRIVPTASLYEDDK